VDEVVCAPEDAAGYRLPLLHGAFFTLRLTAKFVSQMLHAVSESQTRYAALNALWYFMRRAEVDANLPLYILSYLLWRESQAVVRGDPILGPLSEDLYGFASHWFGHLELKIPETHVEDRSLGFLGLYGITHHFDETRRSIRLQVGTIGQLAQIPQWGRLSASRP
jgi:hypothetical protein